MFDLCAISTACYLVGDNLLLLFISYILYLAFRTHCVLTYRVNYILK
jgi:hypothetical protein